jgi:hypothetical protein
MTERKFCLHVEMHNRCLASQARRQSSSYTLPWEPEGVQQLGSEGNVGICSVKLHNLYPSPGGVTVIRWRRMGWAGHAEHMGEIRNVWRHLIGKPEGETSPVGAKRRLEDNIKTHLKWPEWENVDCAHLAQNRNRWWVLVSTVINLRVSWRGRGGGDLFTTRETVPT